ncbi:hypothetical protein [Streptomyces sp. NPDC093111]|uniref:hypothetical protein n=1 Tax=Streptomyces sp. NPDC093111 TaxID=3154978 RepID=UPI00341EC353
MTATDFLGRPLVEPPANTVTAVCPFCSFMGPTHWIGTPLDDVLAAVGVHVRDDHAEVDPDAAAPKLYYGFVNGLTEESRIRVNAQRAENPYGDGETCPPGCECGQ